MAKQMTNRNITPRANDFAQWYTDILNQADLCDYGGDNGSVKGTIVFRPYGYALWEAIQFFLNQQFKALKVQNVMFPLLINEKSFAVEKNHIAGFAPECAIVTQVGDKILQDKLIIRPTSEVMFCQQFQRVLKSYKQLPLLYNQWCSVVRWEKTTRPFLRNSEFLWQEGHTIHETSTGAKAFALQIIQLYSQFVKEYLAINVVVGTKTEHERFAGALETYSIEMMMQDGQALQAGTSHYFGQEFAKLFDIKFNNSQNQPEFGYQTSWGTSTRLIGGLIMVHSDDLGLVLPSKITPYQIAILNLQPKNDQVKVFIDQLSQNLTEKFRVYLNNDDKTSGYKKNETFIKGIPLIIEVGLREVENNSVTVVMRNDFATKDLNLTNKNYVNEIASLLSLSDQKLLAKSEQNFIDSLKFVTDFANYQKIIKTHYGYVIAPFCGRLSCEEEIKNLTSTTSRCIPFNKIRDNSLCFKCSKPDSPWTYFARAY